VKRLLILSSTLGKLTLQIGYELLGGGEHAVGRRAHLRTSSGPTFQRIILCGAATKTIVESGASIFPRRMTAICRLYRLNFGPPNGRESMTMQYAILSPAPYPRATFEPGPGLNSLRENHVSPDQGTSSD